MPIRILIADDHAIIRSGLKALLSIRHWPGSTTLAMALRLFMVRFGLRSSQLPDSGDLETRSRRERSHVFPSAHGAFSCSLEGTREVLLPARVFFPGGV